VTAPTRARGLFQPWMVANLAVGMGQFTFVPLLIVPYVTQAAGQASAGGAVVAIIGLSALTAPVVGGFAERYRAYRGVFTAGIAAMALSMALYAWSALNGETLALVAILFGVGIAGIQSVGPVFIVSVGLDEQFQSRRLAAYNLITSVGLVVAGLLLALVAPWTYAQKFLLAAGLLTVIAVVVWLTSGHQATLVRPRPAPVGADAGEPTGVRAVFRGTFGILMLMAVFAGMGYNAMISQVGNIMGSSFGWEPSQTSLMLGISGLVNIGGFILAGALMARKGALTTATVAQVFHLTGLVGLALLSLLAGPAGLVVAFAMLCFYMGEPYGRIPQPVLAVRFSRFSASVGTGWYIAVLAGSSSVGGLVAGALAQTFDYSAVLWMAAVCFAVSLAVVFLGLWPAERRLRAATTAAGAPPEPEPEALTAPA
jgi:predicted MFS family arabinose efflux permease